MKSEAGGGHMTLAQWMIALADGKAYRAGKAHGMKHPAVDRKMIESAGGLRSLIEQAGELEKEGFLEAEYRDMGNDIRRIHFSSDVIPELCRREGTEDPRQRQLRYITLTGKRREEAEGTFLVPYYDGLLARLERGDEIKNTDLEDDGFFRAVNAVALLKEPVWRRVLSIQIFGDSKTFESAAYQPRILSVLEHFSPYYQEGMTADEVLCAHGVMTYSQTLEWKGPLRFCVDGAEMIDTSVFRYGTVINAQTMERADPCVPAKVKRIITIENKTNYEDMNFSDDTLYIYCHGFFSPKEAEFLKKLAQCAQKEIQYFHWGDMDLGGIRIFLFIREHIFPDLQPYRMDCVTYEEAVRAGCGRPIDRAKREKLAGMDAGILEELKSCILKYGREIEQEQLLGIRGTAGPQTHRSAES